MIFSKQELKKRTLVTDIQSVQTVSQLTVYLILHKSDYFPKLVMRERLAAERDRTEFQVTVKTCFIFVVQATRFVCYLCRKKIYGLQP